MIRSLIPFTQLTRNGMPEFRVCRLPLFLGGAEVPVGKVVAVDSFPNRIRVRQMYEQRRIEPVTAPKGSVQEARERMERGMGRAPGIPVDRSVGQALDRWASGSADVLLDMDSLPVPVEDHVEESVAEPKPKPVARGRGYQPARGVKR